MGSEEIDRAVIEASFDIEGKKKIKCAAALDLAEKHKVSPREIGRSCNRTGVKITECQLGLFK